MNYNCNKKRKAREISLSSFCLFASRKINWNLFYKEGKNDERNKECACQNADARKVFLDHAVIGVKFGWHGRCCDTS